MTSSFKRLNTSIFQKSAVEVTPDSIYWRQLNAPLLLKEFGPIDYIDFSPTDLTHFAVTCSVRIQVYNSITKLVVKNLSRFKENAFGGVFRQDGRLLCAGSEETTVKLFDVATKNLLRVFSGHSAAVHRTHFASSQPQLVSFSDDKTVKVWDIPMEKAVHTFAEHTDYVRAGAVNSAAPTIMASGGYDSLVKVYDTRQNNIILSMNHGAPIESTVFLSSGGVLVTAGGNDIKLWDLVAGGRLLSCLSHHHKTITCLALASDKSRLLSGSLDRHVKIYDISSFRVVHTIDYPNAVLSVGVSANDDTVVAGLVDGLVSVRRRDKSAQSTAVDRKQTVAYSYKSTTNTHATDVCVAPFRPDKEARYDHFLRKFQFKKVLRLVLITYVTSKTPHVTVSVLQELLRRQALIKTLTGLESKTMLSLVRFCVKHITDYRFTRVLISVVQVCLDLFEQNVTDLSSPELIAAYLNLCDVVRTECEHLENLAKLQGGLFIMLSANSSSTANVSNAGATIDGGDVAVESLQPSGCAQQNLVITLR